jgi:hypothetical protein
MHGSRLLLPSLLSLPLLLSLLSLLTLLSLRTLLLLRAATMPAAAAGEFVDDLIRAAASSNAAVSGKMYDTANNWTTVRYGWQPVADASSSRLQGGWDGPTKQLQWWMGKRPLQTPVTVLNTGQTPDKPTAGTFYNTAVASDGRGALDGSCPDKNEVEARSVQVFFTPFEPAANSTLCDGQVWIPEGITIYPNNTWTWDSAPLGETPKDLTYSDRNFKCPSYTQGTSRADNQAARTLLRSMLLPGGTDITWTFTGPCRHQIRYRDDFYGAWKAFSGPGDTGLGPNAVYTGDGRYPAPGPNATYYDTTTELGDLNQQDTLVFGIRNRIWSDHEYTYNLQQVRFGLFDASATLEETEAAYHPSKPQSSRWYALSWCPPDGGATGWTSGDATCTLSVVPVQSDVAGSLPGCAAALPDGVPFITCRSKASGQLLRIDPALAGSFKTLTPPANPCTIDGGGWRIDINDGTSCPTPITDNCWDTVYGLGTATCCTVYQYDWERDSLYRDVMLDPNNVPQLSSMYLTLGNPSGTCAVPPACCPAPGPCLAANCAAATSRPAKIIMGVDFVISDNSNDPSPHTIGSAGRLPEVACNKQAYSPRFGGRCAAPVVQYLAYDEAYHMPGNTAQYGLPEYGGCLSGGLMRRLGTNVMADPTGLAAPGITNSDLWDQYKSWWTPPLWPLDAWFNLRTTLNGGNTALDAFLSDQARLNSLFVYQDAFKVGNAVKIGPAGGF